MAGNGYALSQLAFEGADVWLGDLNPAMVSLALLRDPRILRQHSSLAASALDFLRPFKPKRAQQKRFDHVEDWVAPSITEQLDAYLRLLGIGRLNSPFSQSGAFWAAPAKVRFIASLPVLAARELTCYRMSDNYAWLKKGGVCREANLYYPVVRALERWSEFAEALSSSRGDVRKEWGEISARLMNVESGYFGDSPMADVIITSPPYANRLDYTSMWAPELEILSTMWGGDSKLIKAAQIGSTVIKGKTVLEEEETDLPSSILETLTAIRDDKNAWASDRYYYPFFRNYALSLRRSLIQIGARLKPGGILVVFVRDTVRKDVMFATSELIRDVFTRYCDMCEVDRVRSMHRSHLGLRRRGSIAGLYGLAQREWWLTFRKAHL
jgi:hypothetical protein